MSGGVQYLTRKLYRLDFKKPVAEMTRSFTGAATQTGSGGVSLTPAERTWNIPFDPTPYILAPEVNFVIALDAESGGINLSNTSQDYTASLPVSSDATRSYFDSDVNMRPLESNEQATIGYYQLLEPHFFASWIWMPPENDGDTIMVWTFSETGGEGGPAVYSLFIDNSRSLVYSVASVSDAYTAPGAIPTGEWVHIASRIVGSTAELWINGQVMPVTLNSYGASAGFYVRDVANLWVNRPVYAPYGKVRFDQLRWAYGATKSNAITSNHIHAMAGTPTTTTSGSVALLQTDHVQADVLIANTLLSTDGLTQLDLSALAMAMQTNPNAQATQTFTEASAKMWWLFNDYSDSSGRGNSLSNSTGIALSTYAGNPCLYFNSMSSSASCTLQNIGLNNRKYTISWWHFSHLPVNTFAPGGSPDNAKNIVQIGGLRFGVYENSWRYMFNRTDNNLFVHQILDTNSPLAQELMHVAVVCDADNDTVQVYVKGVLFATVNFPNLGSLSDGQSLIFGEYVTTDAAFEMSLMDVRLFTSALTQEQITDIRADFPAQGSIPSSTPDIKFNGRVQVGEYRDINATLSSILARVVALENA